MAARRVGTCTRTSGGGESEKQDARLEASQPPECFGLYAHPAPGRCHVAQHNAPFHSLLNVDYRMWEMSAR